MEKSSLFFICSLVLFILVGMITGEMGTLIDDVVKLLLRIAPAVAGMVILFGFFDYFVDKKRLIKFMESNERSGLAHVVFAIAGILSSGPIYLWYPLLDELRQHGVKYGFIAIFLYNRAVKIALLPLMITYFGVVYVAVLTIVMVLMSFVNGFIVDFFMYGRNDVE